MTFLNIKKRFRELTPQDQEKLLGDVYAFSEDVRLFMENRLCGSTKMYAEYIRQMERETINKVYRKGTPSVPNGKTVNAIIAKAKKSHVDIYTLIEIEQLAYRGFVEFLNEFGGGPESFEDQSCKHLEAYLKLLHHKQITSEERTQRHEDLKTYLLAKDNMITDSLDEVFVSITGMRIER